MVALAEAHAVARKPAAAVSMVESAADRRRDRTGPGADLDDAAVRVVAHHHAARIAGQAAGRFCGNAHAVFQDGLAGLLGIGKGRRVDVDDHLVALTRGAGIDAVVEGRFREQGQRIGLLLLHGRWIGVGLRPATLHSPDAAAFAIPPRPGAPRTAPGRSWRSW
jgi:hypothetical protein